MTTQAHRNRLAEETSPYLLQHADNPVDWHPWGPEALSRAESEDKPILLSIGYSACHWCHVMAHESFEHNETAELMNRLFINIKVDREERPDLDKIYQLAQQILTRRTGGWPLTIFLTPGSLVPFFAGTYFPRDPRYGMPGFREVLQRVSRFYHEQREAVENQNAELLKLFESLDRRAPEPGTPDASALDMARHQLEHEFDPHFGGFGAAPKFPHPPNITRLMRHYAVSRRNDGGDEKALHMALHSLERMALGGLFDQLGGGFCRYSVDAEWNIPHFEKMLYDNAMLMPQYAEAHRLRPDALFERTARETAAWVMREMQSPEGGYYSSLDADSEGEEGKFYVWSPDEIRALLTEDEYRVFAGMFGLDGPANFEDRWHLQVVRGAEDIATETGMQPDDVQRLVGQARQRLFEARERRMHPGRDDKILTSWNALMVRGMTITARELDDETLRKSADRALGFIRSNCWHEGRLFATFKDGRAHLTAYLDDYAYLLDAVLESLQTRWRDEDIGFAIGLADALLKHFEDSERGGFFFTAHDHEKLIQRPKPFSDDSLPAGNGVAARALQRLGHLLGETRYIDAAEHTLQAAWHQVSEMPYAHNTLLDALEETLVPPQIVVLRGEPRDLDEWLKSCHDRYAPTRIVVAIPSASPSLPGLLGERPAADSGVLAYVCSGTVCRAPVDRIEKLHEALDRD